MSYFENTIETVYSTAIQKVVGELDQAHAQAAKKGLFVSGGMWKTREKILIDNVTQYSNTLIDILTAHETNHSPIKQSDFKIAKKSIIKFRNYCEESHKRLREHKSSVYPKNRPPFDRGSMKNALNNALNKLEGIELEFESKRSFLKWAIGDAKKQGWSAILMFFGGLIFAVGNWLLSFLKTLN